MPTNATLALYTDGLIERRNMRIDDGIDRLAATLARSDLASADNIDSIVAATAPDPEDDVAVLLVSFVEAPATLVLEIPADPREIRGLRRRVHAWLTQHNVEEATQQAAVLALNEACANAIEHAYRDADAGTISIELTQHEKALSIIVEDHGSWREPAHDPNRGRGIFSCETSWRRRRSSVVAEAPASYSRPRSDADPYVVRAAQEPEPAAERFLEPVWQDLKCARPCRTTHSSMRSSFGERESSPAGTPIRSAWLKRTRTLTGENPTS